MDWIKYVSAMLAILSMVKKLVVEFEHPGFGQDKKQAVLNAVGVLYDTADEFAGVPVPKEKVLAAVDKMIDIVVGFYNLVGVFQHGQKQTT